MKYFIFLLKFTVILIVAFYIAMFIDSKTFGEFGINKTVGWAWDLISLIFALFYIYIATYITLFLLKVKTNLIFSILSIILLVLTLFFTLSNNSMFFITFTTSILFFISNFIYSMYLKFKK